MIDTPTPPLPASEPVTAHAEVASNLPTEQRADGVLVINLLPLAPPPTQCALEEPDPFNPEIIVCRETELSPRIGPDVLAEVDDFGIAIPRARIKLSEHAEGQANATAPSVGGWNAQGGEVRVKIDF